MSYLYISEPAAIPVDEVRQRIGSTYTIMEGDPTFRDASSHSDVTALMIRSETQVTSTIIQTFPHLKHIIRVGTGVDNVDLTFCKQSGIAVYNAAGANADAVSEYVVTMLLTALRKTHYVTDSDVANWNRFKFRGRSISECTVGIVGFGNIGRLIYDKLRAFGCTNFIVHDPFVDANTLPEHTRMSTSVDELLPLCDAITLHIPLLDSTRNLIDQPQLAIMKKDAILINASRGGIVQEESVTTHAAIHHDFVYIADTVDGEPHVNPALLGHENILVTPHIASLTSASERAMLETAIQNFITNKPMQL